MILEIQIFRFYIQKVVQNRIILLGPLLTRVVISRVGFFIFKAVHYFRTVPVV
jgi:hypothetical protein